MPSSYCVIAANQANQERGSRPGVPVFVLQARPVLTIPAILAAGEVVIERT
jgi:hypothetical protein